MAQGLGLRFRGFAVEGFGSSLFLWHGVRRAWSLESGLSLWVLGGGFRA